MAGTVLFSTISLYPFKLRATTRATASTWRKVGLAAGLLGGADTDEDDGAGSHRGFHIIDGLKSAAARCFDKQVGKAGFKKNGVAAADQPDLARIVVGADNVPAQLRQPQGGGKADVAQAQNRDRGLTHLDILLRRLSAHFCFSMLMALEAHCQEMYLGVNPIRGVRSY